MSVRGTLRTAQDAHVLHRGGNQSVFRIGDTTYRAGDEGGGQFAALMRVSDQALAIEDGWPLCKWGTAGQSL